MKKAKKAKSSKFIPAYNSLGCELRFPSHLKLEDLLKMGVTKIQLIPKEKVKKDNPPNVWMVKTKDLILNPPCPKSYQSKPGKP